MTDLSIIVVNFNTKELLESCLNSVLAHTSGISYELIVVDNDSRDGSADLIVQQFARKVKLIALPENIGFGPANNVGYEQSTGECILFLNSDAQLINNSLFAMVRFLRETRNAGACCPQLLFPDGRKQFSFDTLISPRKFFVAYVLKPIIPSKGSERFSPMVKSGPMTIERPRGACFMTRRRVLEQIGVFDPQFFMYCEEVDLSRRMLDAGFLNYFLPDVEVIHHWGGSSKQVSDRMERIHIESNYKYFAKHYGVLGVASLRSIYLLNTLINTGKSAAGGILGKGRVRDAFRIFRRGLRRAFASY